MIPGSLLMIFLANEASNGMSFALRQLNTIVKFFKVSTLSALSLNSSKFDNRPAFYNAKPNFYPFENAFSKLSSSFKFILPFDVSQFQATKSSSLFRSKLFEVIIYFQLSKYKGYTIRRIFCQKHHQQGTWNHYKTCKSDCSKGFKYY